MKTDIMKQDFKKKRMKKETEEKKNTTVGPRSRT
jgi:hypothetical protein